jgi:hypothetical protein
MFFGDRYYNCKGYDSSTNYKDEHKEDKPNVQIPEVDTGLDIIVALDDVKQWLRLILEELKSSDDEGEYMFVQGTANTDPAQNITDLLGMIGHPVKGYMIKNDDLVNTLEVGHNITMSSIDSTIQTASARFFPVFTGELHKEMFNRKVIRNVYLRTAAGTAPYRLWLLW